jgi:pimeloyl-ACP methyl ester carboxylesterase
MTIDIDGRVIVAAVNDDPEFDIFARDWTSVVRLQKGDQCWDAEIVAGKLVAFAQATERTPDIQFSGPEAIWMDLFAVVQKPLHVGLPFLANRMGLLQETGDWINHSAPYGFALQRLFEAIRHHVTGADEIPAATDSFTETDCNIVGRYVYICVDGIDYRIYFEEAGEGVPMLLQHTAGCHGSQWRHTLADPVLQRQFRMIAYDLPNHGNSLPSLNGPPWWQNRYMPSKDHLMKIVLALSHALELDRPVFMGCSIGGQLALDLAAHYPDEFRAFISLNGTYGHGHKPEGFDAATDPMMELPHHPRLSNDFAAISNYMNTAPLASETFRREVSWVYGQGGPGILRGDAIYHCFFHDLREDGHLIDAVRSPVYVLTGEHDLDLHVPGGSIEVVDHIPGIRFQILEGLSHFPMTDEPIRFREAIRPILDEVAQLRGDRA